MTAKEARKARTTKNLKQQEANIRAAAKSDPSYAKSLTSLSSSSSSSRSAKPPSRFAAAVAAANQPPPISVSEGSREEGKGRAKEERKKELERRILVNKVSTGSMGKFDKKLEGEPKIKGAKRKVSLFFSPPSSL